MTIRPLRPTLLAVLACIALCGGCGGGSPSSAESTGTQPAGADHLAPADLQRSLGNGFRAGLARLAVMQQRGDDATDLGQPLTPGLLDRVSCRPGASRPTTPGGSTWACSVRWQTVGGAVQRTRYVVSVRPDGCFGAGASPVRHSRYDPTIRAYAEDPLNAIVSADPRCS